MGNFPLHASAMDRKSTLFKSLNYLSGSPLSTPLRSPPFSPSPLKLEHLLAALYLIGSAADDHGHASSQAVNIFFSS